MTAAARSRPLPAGPRLALGMLTVVPVRVTKVDRATARAAMLWAPAVGVLVGVLQCVLFIGVRWATGDGLVAAAAAVAGGALLTRGLHLDGLADVADGLGSGRPAAQALDIMKRSDIGPFGVVSLLLTLLIQVTALAAADRHGAAGLAIVVAAGTGRLALPWACRRGVPAARPDGLGALVAGTVPTAGAVGVTVPAMAGCAAAGAIAFGPCGAVGVPAAVAVALAVAALFRRHLVRRFGGVTGDVLGALAEISATAALLMITVAANAATGAATSVGTGVGIDVPAATTTAVSAPTGSTG